MDRVIIGGIPSENIEMFVLLFTCIKNSIHIFYYLFFYYSKNVVLNLRVVSTNNGTRGKVIRWGPYIQTKFDMFRQATACIVCRH